MFKGLVRLFGAGTDDDFPQRREPSRHGAHDSREAEARSTVPDEIQAHVEKHYGPIASVLHETVSEGIHLDLLVVAPRADRPYWIFVTMGMSERPMNVDPRVEEPENFRYAELVMGLPADRWRDRTNDAITFRGPGEYPLLWLKWLARYPHLYDTWFGPGHTIPAGNPPGMLGPDTKACGFWFWRAVTVEPEFDELTTRDGTRINFYGVYPLYAGELGYKLRNGSDALCDAMEAAEITEVFKADRPSVLACED
jgi:hypothetical protein